MKMFWAIPLMFFLACSSQQEEKKLAVADDLGLVIYNADSARNDFEKGNRRIMLYGLRAMRLPQEVNDSLCKAYHFTEYEATGCEVTDAFLKGVQEYNQAMYALLDELNGKDWRNRYEKTLDSLVDLHRKRQEAESQEEDSMRKISEKFRKASDSVEAKNERDAAVAYSQRMDAYKKQLSAEKKR